MPKSANPTPRKASSRSQLKERQPTLILPDEVDHPSTSTGSHTAEDGHLGWADLQALAEDYDLEAAHHLRLLSSSLSTRLSALSRHWDDVVSSLDVRVRDLSLARFVNEFGADPERALRGTVKEAMRPVEMGEGEKGARKRKRVTPHSPRAAEEDPFAAGPSTASKKLRPTTASSAQKPKDKAGKSKKKSSAVPGSVRSIRTGTAAVSPTSTRKASGRLRIRPSHNPLSHSTAGNFVYNASARPSSVLPTPSFPRTLTSSARAQGGCPPATIRRPKRGESIVLKSLNGSPLGEFVASDDDDEEDSSSTEEGQAEDEEAEGSEEWDLMSRHEASRTEAGAFSKANRSPSKGKLTKAPPPPLTHSASTSSALAPSKPAFDPALSLPADAPSFAALKEAFAEKMREELRVAMGGMEGLGEEERRRVEEIVGRSLRGL
ncbi:hypothetical protein JCM11251_003215 [Rhodosporidiobolus azoricus]